MAIAGVRRSLEDLRLSEEAEYEDIRVHFFEPVPETGSKGQSEYRSTKGYTDSVRERTKSRLKFTTKAQAKAYTDKICKYNPHIQPPKIAQQAAYLRAAVLASMPQKEFWLSREEREGLDPKERQDETSSKIRKAYDRYSLEFLKKEIRK